MSQPDHPLLQSLRPEARILLEAGRVEGAGIGLEKILEQGLDWSIAGWLAQREKAVVALWERLSGVRADLVPAPVREALRLQSMVVEFKMRRFEDSLAAALAVLHAQGISVVLLKGAALGVTLYGTLTRRPVTDLDLLVRPEAADDAWQALHRAGWRAASPDPAPVFYAGHHHLPQLIGPDSNDLKIELHRHLVPQSAAFRIDLDRLWAVARPVTFRGHPALVSDPEYQALHACVHFAWSDMLTHGWWTAFRDLEMLFGTAGVDLERFLQLAIDARARTCCYWTCRLARHLFASSIPAPVEAALRPPGSGWVQRRLEEHYVRVAFLGSPPCPSVQLNRWLWGAGIRPTWSGHGDLRPWQNDERWLTGREAMPARAGRSPFAGFARIGNALAYLTSL